MNTWTRVLLVVLRVAIGWHFLFEGLDKVTSYLRGPAEGKTVFTSEFYLREASGPLAGFFREQAGDLDAPALERLDSDGKHLPPVVENDWDARYQRMLAHYDIGSVAPVQPEYVGMVAVSPFGSGLTPLPLSALIRVGRLDPAQKPQRAFTDADYQQVKNNVQFWFAHGKREATRSFSQINEKVPETTPQRIKAYKAKLDEIAVIENTGMKAFGQDVWKDKLKTMKKEAATMRVELLADLNKPFKDFVDFTTAARLSKSQRDKGSTTEPRVSRPIDRVDQLTMWGLTIVGACLILGLFTRLSCLAGAAFLLVVYASMPPVPWVPINPKVEGHYFIVSKNLVEMIALLALATTNSGKWLGLDGLIQFLNPFTYRRVAPNAPALSSPSRSSAHGAASRAETSAKEAYHGP